MLIVPLMLHTMISNWSRIVYQISHNDLSSWMTKNASSQSANFSTASLRICASILIVFDKSQGPDLNSCKMRRNYWPYNLPIFHRTLTFHWSNQSVTYQHSKLFRVVFKFTKFRCPEAVLALVRMDFVTTIRFMIGPETAVTSDSGTSASDTADRGLAINSRPAIQLKEIILLIGF